ncbi:hypothetical protein SFUMM280S_10979 [Streptomyces fumanus]
MGAEPFRLGKGARDSYVFTAPGMNHGANVAGLVPEQKALATARILDWAGVASAAVQENPSAAKPLARFDAKLDRGTSSGSPPCARDRRRAAAHRDTGRPRRDGAFRPRRGTGPHLRYVSPYPTGYSTVAGSSARTTGTGSLPRGSARPAITRAAARTSTSVQE